MARIEPIHRTHFAELYRVALEAEPYQSTMTLDQFVAVMAGRHVWTVLDDNRIIGAISYSDYAPGQDATIHCFIHPDFHSNWLTKDILHQVFKYPFVTLDLPRISGFGVPALTMQACHMQDRFGFMVEGIKRKAIRIGGELHDVRLVGMLKEECRFL